MTPKRFDLIDVLRGYLLIWIFIDHLELFPNIFQFLTGRGLLWISAAEGFFFLSGMMVTIARIKPGQPQTWKEGRKKLWQRAGKLLIITAVLSIVTTIVARLVYQKYGLQLKTDLDATTPTSEVVLRSLVLNYSYTWADFLRYYTVLIALAAPISRLVTRFSYKLLAPLFLLPWLICWLTNSQSSSSLWFVWFGYFFLGVLAGWNVDKIGKMAKKLISTKWAVWLLIGSFLACVTVSWLMVIDGKFESSIVDRLLESSRLGIGRLVIFAWWFSALSLILYFITNKWQWLKNILSKLGQQSLRVYLLQSLLLLMIPVIHLQKKGFVFNSIVALTALLIVIGLSRFKIVKKLIPN